MQKLRRKLGQMKRQYLKNTMIQLKLIETMYLKNDFPLKTAIYIFYYL